MLRPTVLALLLLTAPLTSAPAQVGYPPERSPYRDLEFKQEFSLITGWYAAGRDPVGIAPRSGPIFGARYEVRVGGPAQFTVRLAKVLSDRRIVDPTRPQATRFLGTESWPLYLGDLSLTLNLTGQKSRRRLVPVLNSGIGLIGDFHGADVGGFRIGSQFAFSFGAGVRWVPGGKWQVRADLADYLYQITYPGSYALPASDSTSVLGGRSASAWKHNAALTIGGSYLFFR